MTRCPGPAANTGALAVLLAVALLLLVPGAETEAQTRLLDDFEILNGWYPVTSHGNASRMKISAGEGKTGKGMVMEFGFLGYMGSAAAEKKLGVTLPANYQISFDIRGEGPVNNFIIRLMDSLDNVWWVNRSNFTFPKTWTRFTIKKHQLPYGWGPSGGGELHRLDRIMLMIDVVEGGSGKVWIDNLALEPIDEGSTLPPGVTASSHAPRMLPRVSADGNTVTGWKSAERKGTESLVFDFHKKRVLGGMVIDWDQKDFPVAFDLLLSDDAKHWNRAYRVTRGSGKRSYLYLQEGEGRYFKLDLLRSSRGKGYGILRLEFRGPEFAFSVNDFFGALAADARRGFYPRHMIHEQSYWTVVGAAADTKEALINEEGMIETDKLSFSLDPFLFVDGHLRTWNDVSLSQDLAGGVLPIPSVHWAHPDSLSLTITACSPGQAGKSALLAKYTIANRSARPRKGKLFVAVRPFQVNPPWQTFTIVGGAARIDSIACGEILRVNNRVVVPVTRPDAVGAAEFDQGHVTEFLREGIVPPDAFVHDHFGYASAALQFDFDLPAGGSKAVVLAIPFHHGSPLPVPNQSGNADVNLFARDSAATARFWGSKLSGVQIRLPGSAQQIISSIQSNLCYILINADGPGTQPGSRSYERSWIRDGSLTSAALLQMGIADEVRRYLDWYAGFQYPDGKIPCIVESRGPEPTPEHDSHGQFIYAIAQYFRFTHDTTWLRGKWDNVLRTVRYIQSLRDQRKTGTYRSGTPEQQACYGLVPESISHEGYCPKPMHSYWDDFFVMRGLKDAVIIAEALGKKDAARELAAERDDFRDDLYRSIQLSMQIKKINFIPGCVELGDPSGLSTTIAVSPCGELQNLPRPQLDTTFEQSYRTLLDRKRDSTSWTSYLPYEARFIGTFVQMNQRERAMEYLEFLMKDRRPAGWNQWAEVVWREMRAPKSVGDMPHSWAASDFIRSVRSMLVYEREDDDALVIGAGIPESWVSDPAGIEVRDLPTYYGKINYRMTYTGRRLTVKLSGLDSLPPGKVIVRSPVSSAAASISGPGRLSNDGREVVLDRLPARIELSY